MFRLNYIKGNLCPIKHITIDRLENFKLRNSPTPLLSRRSYSDCPPSLQCKVSIVTGGASGIGLAIARQLMVYLAKGVVIVDSNKKAGEEAMCMLNKEFCSDKVVFENVDVMKKDDMRKVFECTKKKFGGIDLLVNNAALVNELEWEKTMCIGTYALVVGTMLAFEFMGKHKCGKGGTVINVLSTAGVEPVHILPVLTGAKHFGVGFTRSIGHEWFMERTAVRVMGLLPGLTDTPLSDKKNVLSKLVFKELAKEAETLLSGKKQQACEVAKCLTQMYGSGKSGNLVIIEGGQCYKIDMPDRKTFKRCDFK